MRIREQLDELAAKLARAQQELAVAREQIAFQSGVADEAQVRERDHLLERLFEDIDSAETRPANGSRRQ